MIHCLICASEPTLNFCFDLIKSGINQLYSIVVNSLCSARKEQIGRQFPTSSTSPFWCTTFVLNLRHVYGVHSFCFITSLQICLTISFVSSPHALMSSALIPLLSADLPFFPFDGSLQLFGRDLWNFRLFYIGTLIFYVVFGLIFVGFHLCFIILIVIIQLAVEFSKDVSNSFS